MLSQTQTSSYDSLLKMREEILRFFSESMHRIDITPLMMRSLSVRSGSLHAGGTSIPLREKQKILLVAVGKAAIPMCAAAASALERAIELNQTLRGIAVGPGDPSTLPASIQHFAAAHPFPDQTSCDVAEAVIGMLTPLGPSDLVLYLISGGASAMLEAPIEPITCEEMTAFYRALVHSGLPITSMNTLRKHLSKVKGGRLAVAAAPAQQLTLLVSDVPGGTLDAVGSGPSLPDPSTVSDCRAILSALSQRDRISPAILRYFADPALAETPKPAHPAFRRSAHVCLLSNEILLQQVEHLASLAGYHTEVDTTCDDWAYEDAEAYLLNKVRKLRETYERVCVISGGELSVQVDGNGGLGGRNQHFLLHCALQLKDDDPKLVLLSAGTDGVDGNSPAAGAIVDSSTPARILQLGLNARLALQQFDSYSLLDALGDTIITGPTGNNVRDLRIILSAD
jgi:hydroxypyruvate reductase